MRDDAASARSGAGRVSVLGLNDLEAGIGSRLSRAQLDRLDYIFFASSLRRTFADDTEGASFRERWLGRYLEFYRDHFFVALEPGDRIVGYLAGCLNDPACEPRFADIAYFARLRDLTRDYPAHLHINVDPDWRNRQIGARLIEAFCAHAAAAGVAGVHVVTGATSRNLAFYDRRGFVRLRDLAWNGVPVALLGRRLSA